MDSRVFDYGDLKQSMAQLDVLLRETRRSLDVVEGPHAPAVAQAPSTGVGNGMTRTADPDD
jgi:hypothetical protein